MLPVIPKVPPQDKRLVLVDLTRTLFRGQATASLANNEPWYVQVCGEYLSTYECQASDVHRTAASFRLASLEYSGGRGSRRRYHIY